MAKYRPVFVLRHSYREEAGYLAEALRRSGVPFRFFDLHADASVGVPLGDCSALAVLGGAQSVNSGFAYLHREMDLIANAMSTGKPVLGICLGSQLMARSLGEPVYRIPVPEIGWFAVRAAPGSLADPLFHDWGERVVFHWHNEGYNLPEGAVHLACSDACGVQAFRYGEIHWGIQFHPEVTPEIIQRWNEEDAACGCERELSEPLDASFQRQEMRQLANTMFDRWVQMVIERS